MMTTYETFFVGAEKIKCFPLLELRRKVFKWIKLEEYVLFDTENKCILDKWDVWSKEDFKKMHDDIYWLFHEDK